MEFSICLVGVVDHEAGAGGFTVDELGYFQLLLGIEFSRIRALEEIERVVELRHRTQAGFEGFVGDLSEQLV